MRKYNKDGTVSEYQIQKTVCDWLDLHNVFYHSIPNEAANNAIKGRHLKATGLKKGASDLKIAEAHHHFIGMYLELKNEKGFVRPEQTEFFRRAEKAGHFTAAAWSVDEAIDIIKWYLSKPFEWKKT